MPLPPAPRPACRWWRFERPPGWPAPGDDWHHVPDMAAAVAALPEAPARVFLAIGKQHLDCLCRQAAAPLPAAAGRSARRPLPLPDAPCRHRARPVHAGAGDLRPAARPPHQPYRRQERRRQRARAPSWTPRARLRLPVILIDRPALPPRRVLRRSGRGDGLAASSRRPRRIDKAPDPAGGANCRRSRRCACRPSRASPRPASRSADRFVRGRDRAGEGDQPARRRIPRAGSPARGRTGAGGWPSAGCRTPWRNRPRAASRRRRSTRSKGFRLSDRLIAQKSWPKRRAGPRRRRQHRGDAGQHADIEAVGSAGAASSASNTAEAMAKTPGSPDETTTTRAPFGRHVAAHGRRGQSRPGCRRGAASARRAGRRGRHRGYSPPHRSPRPAPRVTSGVTSASAPGPRPATTSQPVIRRLRPPAVAMHQHDREIGQSALVDLGQPLHPLPRHGAAFDQPGLIQPPGRGQRAAHAWAGCARSSSPPAHRPRACGATRSSSGRVPISTVSTSSPQVIGTPVAVQQPDMPVMPGTTSTSARPCRRDMQMHEGAVEERITLAQHHHILRFGQRGQPCRPSRHRRRASAAIVFGVCRTGFRW